MSDVYLTITKDDMLKIKRCLIAGTKDYEEVCKINSVSYYLIAAESAFSSKEDDVENTFQIKEYKYYFPVSEYEKYLDDFLTETPKDIDELTKTRFSCLIAMLFSHSAYGSTFIEQVFDCARYSYQNYLCSRFKNEDNFKLQEETVVDDYIVEKKFVYVC